MTNQGADEADDGDETIPSFRQLHANMLSKVGERIQELSRNPVKEAAHTLPGGGAGKEGDSGARLGSRVWDWTKGTRNSLRISLETMKLPTAFDLVSPLLLQGGDGGAAVSEWISGGSVYGVRARVIVAAIATLIVVIVSALVVIWFQAKKKEKRLHSLIEILESDPDLSVFHRFWLGMGNEGPWDRPNLSAPLPDDATSIVLFAPKNEAFQTAAGQRLILSLDGAGWRKLLVSHCAYSPHTSQDIVQMSTCSSCTGATIPLECLRDRYTDGTDKYIQPRMASNGMLFKVPIIIQPQEE